MNAALCSVQGAGCADVPTLRHIHDARVSTQRVGLRLFPPARLGDSPQSPCNPSQTAPTKRPWPSAPFFASENRRLEIPEAVNPSFAILCKRLSCNAASVFSALDQSSAIFDTRLNARVSATGRHGAKFAGGRIASLISACLPVRCPASGLADGQDCAWPPAASLCRRHCGRQWHLVRPRLQ